MSLSFLPHFSPQLKIVVSFNRPKFSPCAAWNSSATTFSDDTVTGTGPGGIFINSNDTIYVLSPTYNSTLIWSSRSASPTRNFTDDFSLSSSLFVTTNGDVYIDNGATYQQVEKWFANASSFVPVMQVDDACYGLFVDINSTLYCSVSSTHSVVKKSLMSSTKVPVTAVGTGAAGAGSKMLSDPSGIFVDDTFTLYVADSSNDRIQSFPAGSINGRTVAGNGAAGTITLSYPTGISLDGDGYLFIVDNGNARIIGSGPNGFRCVAGCAGAGSTPNALDGPKAMAFDSYGSMYVLDFTNDRIQKFNLVINSCGKHALCFRLTRGKDISRDCDTHLN